MDYPQPKAPACIVLKWHFAAVEGYILKVGRRNKSIRTQLWEEVGKEGLKHLWSKQRCWRHKLLSLNFIKWRGKGRVAQVLFWSIPKQESPCHLLSLSVFCYSFACLLKFLMPYQRKGMRKSVLGILTSSKSEVDFKIVRQKLLKIKGKLTFSQLRVIFSENQKADCKPLNPRKATSN